MTEPVDLAADLEACRAWIGTEERGSDIVTPELARRFRATLDLPEDVQEPGDVAPLAIHWCLAPPAVPMSGLGRDGHPALGGFLPPVPLPRRMWAGGTLTLAKPIRIGDTVLRVARIQDVVLKPGRTGLLWFVTVHHRFSVAGETVVEERQDIVYRSAKVKSGPSAGEQAVVAPPVPAWTKTVNGNEVLLFRYSALTFNGHRIHYDRRFCLEDEGYPGLVVHGPLQATLLLHFAAELRGGAPREFTFRSTVPLFDGAALSLNATRASNGLRLWTAGPNGHIAMSADATW